MPTTRLYNPESYAAVDIDAGDITQWKLRGYRTEAEILSIPLPGGGTAKFQNSGALPDTRDTLDEVSALAAAGGIGAVTDAAVAGIVGSGASTRNALNTGWDVVLTAAGTAVASALLALDKHTPVDATVNALTMTLPTPTRIGQQVRVEKVDASANAVTVSGTLRGAAGTVVMPFQYEVRTFVAESLSSWRVASGNTPKAALDGTYGQTAAPMRAYFAPRRPASFTDAGRTTPIVAKVKNGAAILTQTASGIASIYWGHLIRVPDSVYAAYPTLGRWRVYFSTDHDTAAGAIAMAYTNAEYPDDPTATWTPWRHPSTASAVLFTEGGTSQTETFTVVWNPLTQVFHHYWQIQRTITGVGLVQVTRVGTSVDGITVSVIGDALPTPSTTLAGYDHTGYAKVWLVDGLWVCWSNLGSGTEISSGSLWYSYDGFTFVRDPRRLRGNLQWTEGTLRTAIAGLFTFRGQTWACGSSGTFTSGITTSDISQSWMAPMNPDLRSLRGRPQYLDFPAVAAAGETGVTSIPHAWAQAPDGRLFGAYRANGSTGQFALAVMS